MKYQAILVTAALLGGIFFRANAQDVIKDTLDFDKAMATTPASLLQGKVAGLRVSPIDGNVNGAINTLIRGVNALRSDSQPLWIVDGVIINASLNRNNDAFWQYGEKSYTSPLNALAYLNPYDIESIEVLKDLSATAIYGAKGAHGVIIVNTGMPARRERQIRWGSNVGISSPEFPIEGASTGISHNHHLDISGTTGQTRYDISAYLRRSEGIFKANNGTYGGLRASFDTKANPVVWFGMNTAISMGQMNSVAGTSYFGQPSLTMTLRNPDFFPSDTAERWAGDYDDNAVERRLTNSTYLTLNFTRSLSLKSSIGVDFQNDNRYIWYGPGTSFGNENKGAASVLGTSIFKYNAKSELSWKHFFSQKNLLVLRAAAEASGEWTKFNTLNGTDFFTYTLRASGVRLAGSAPALHKYDHDYNTAGAYMAASWSVGEIAGVNASLRGDNTARYDDGRFTLYKGADAWFDLKKAFLKDSGLISTLKISGGYGEAGREQYVPYGLYGSYISGSYPRVDVSLEYYYEALNRVRSMEKNAGIYLGLLGDRVMIHAGYYDKLTNDTIFAYCFGAPSKTYTFYWDDAPRSDEFEIGSIISNRGFEGDMELKILDGPGVKWSVRANAAWNVNQLLKVDPSDALGRVVGDGVLVNANVTGWPVGSLYGYMIDADGAYIDKNHDTRINEYDKDIIGNPNPAVTGGFGTSFSFRGFSLDVLANGAWGFDMLDLNALLFNESAPYEISEKYIKKADYMRLGRVSLGYDLPMKKTKWIRGATVSLSAINLLTVSSYDGWNPEVNCFGTTYLSSGVDYGSYPIARSFVAGISVKF